VVTNSLDSQWGCNQFIGLMVGMATGFIGLTVGMVGGWGCSLTTEPVLVEGSRGALPLLSLPFTIATWHFSVCLARDLGPLVRCKVREQVCFVDVLARSH
jgi:hypothetical protein